MQLRGYPASCEKAKAAIDQHIRGSFCQQNLANLALKSEKCIMQNNVM